MRGTAVSICQGIGVNEIAVTEEDRADHTAAQGAPNWGERLGRIGVDWWATIVAGVVVLLAPLLVAVVGLVVVAAVSLGLVLLTSRVFGWGIGAGTSPS